MPYCVTINNEYFILQFCRPSDLAGINKVLVCQNQARPLISDRSLLHLPYLVRVVNNAILLAFTKIAFNINIWGNVVC